MDTIQQDKPDLMTVIFNTVVFYVRKIGHELESTKWKEGSYIYGFYNGDSSWWQACSRDECKWRISIVKNFDIVGRVVFNTRAVLVNEQKVFLEEELISKHDLFEITIGPEDKVVDQYIKDHQMFPFDDKLVNRFVLGSKSCLCKRLVNFI